MTQKGHLEASRSKVAALSHAPTVQSLGASVWGGGGGSWAHGPHRGLRPRKNGPQHPCPSRIAAGWTLPTHPQRGSLKRRNISRPRIGIFPSASLPLASCFKVSAGFLRASSAGSARFGCCTQQIPARGVQRQQFDCGTTTRVGLPKRMQRSFAADLSR